MMELLNKTMYGQPPPAPVEPVEKRSCPRYPFSPAVEALDLQADLRIKGRLADISRNGCYVDTINPFSKDAPVTLTISRDNQSFKTQAKVVYSKIGMGMGLLFTTAEPDQLRVLGSWLNELSSGKVDGEEQSNLFLQPETTKITDVELRKIVSELIALLNSKSILNDSEAMGLLRKLTR
jgi:PilZ domain